MSDLQELLALLQPRSGHFLLESGHHGELWLELDGLLRRPAVLDPWVQLLGERLSASDPQAVVGPWSGGAFVAYSLACQFGWEFYACERQARAYGFSSFQRAALRGKRVVVVDDVVNAGSAVQATWDAVEQAQAHPVGIGALLRLRGPEDPAPAITSHFLWEIETGRWEAHRCPLCAAGKPLESLTLIPPRGDDGIP